MPGGAAQPRSTHSPRVQTEHALDNAVEILRHMNLSLAPAIFVALRVAVVVELHAKRFIDRRDRARDLDPALRGVGFNHLELA